MAVCGHGFAVGLPVRRGVVSLSICFLLFGVAGGYLGFDDAVYLFVQFVAFLLLAGYACAYFLLFLLEITYEFLLFGFATVKFLLLLDALGKECLFVRDFYGTARNY